MEKFFWKENSSNIQKTDSKSLQTWVHILVQTLVWCSELGMSVWFSISFCLSSSLFSLIRSVRWTNTVSAPAEHAWATWCLWGLSCWVKMKEFSLSLFFKTLNADLRCITTVFFQKQTLNFPSALIVCFLCLFVYGVQAMCFCERCYINNIAIAVF